MRAIHILIPLALLVPQALSVPVSDMHSGVEAIDVLAPSLGHAPDEATKASEYVFVGSIKSDKYHYPSCSAAKRIKPENEIWFTSSADARCPAGSAIHHEGQSQAGHLCIAVSYGWMQGSIIIIFPVEMKGLKNLYHNFNISEG